MKIALIYGGKSAEHDVSILSAFSVLKAIYYNYYEVQTIYIDTTGNWLKGPLFKEAPASEEELHLTLANAQPISPAEIKEKNTIIFPVLHGPNGEDGTVQGLFEVLDMPYVGAGVLASACAMDKIIAKQLFQQAGIPQLPYVAVAKRDFEVDREELYARCEGSLLYPMFVKPANMGSSVGINKVENREELYAALEEALKYDCRVVVEQGVEARELEVAVLGNDEIRTTMAGEIVKDVEFYTYESKYIDNQVTLQIPAEITEEVQEKMREYAEKAYVMLDCSGLSRCDFFLTNNNEMYLNEVNTMPGFTPFSMYPLLWENMGLGYSDLLEELIQLAKLRYEKKQAIKVY
ncbi:D-alanine--D-alanine ligase [Vagococcus vulneris]|uniref:D-alanine--D-alanine ligase n=1 Tax=Vagococcus vulneris TaxID=1977869 RepID=A0A429ZXK7_9ENTE|nr:D-alanine--D-alanine ligase [Vagococcus vulneris]RST98580.1 D-alanine--D-alanine ligase A [Vagococcus vulneris]